MIFFEKISFLCFYIINKGITNQAQKVLQTLVWNIFSRLTSLFEAAFLFYTAYSMTI